MASSRSCRSSSANSSFSGRVELTRSDRTWVLAGNNSQTPGNKCGGAYGKSVKASTWRGRTTVKSRWFNVAIRATPRRSPRAMSEASVPPRRKSEYSSTSSAMRVQSASCSGSTRKSPSTIERKSAASATGPSSRSKEIARLSDDQGTRNKRPGVLFQQCPASLVVGIVPISRGEERAGVDQKHSVAPEAVGK